MNSYNGFSGLQRSRAQRWLTEQWSAGVLPRPGECMACGQRDGIIDAHAEDYSAPFAAGKTDEFHLCFRCHMTIHCRFRALASFTRYRRELLHGTIFVPFYTRDFAEFRRQQLTSWCPATRPGKVSRGTDELAYIVGRGLDVIAAQAAKQSAEGNRAV